MLTSEVEPSLQPNTPELERALDDVWVLINQRKATPAHTAWERLVARCPTSPDVWFAGSFLSFQLQQFEAALQQIDRAIELQTDGARWLLHKAHTLLRMQRRTEALRLAEELSNTENQDSEFHAELALVLNNLQCIAEAKKHYQQALTKTPRGATAQQAQLLFNLASVQRYLGEIDAAEACLDKVLRINPLDTEAQLLRSGLRKQSPQQNHINELQILLNKTHGQNLPTAQLCYALAKELEDLQQFESSFACLQKGAKARRSMMRYDVSSDEHILVQLRQHFNADWFAREQHNDTGFDNDEAMFVVGLPRTGSTLVERLLSQSPQVQSAGELNNFAMQMTRQIKQTGAEIRTPVDLIQRSTELNLTTLGEAYIQSTRPETGHTARFIDKLPLNSLNMALIHRALPKAKIIYVTRNPMDACYAIFKNLFTHGYPFSYQLDELARYYAAHYELIQHWQTLMPEGVYQISYEALVHDPAGEGRKLFDWCQLPWRAEYVNTESNQAPSNTASAAQVRQPIHTGSVEKWRHFENQLAPLRELLLQRGIPC